MKPWEYSWFQKTITWCRKWKWFDTYIYGKSVDLEDFVRNPAEVMRGTYFPFVVKGIKAYSVFNLRIGYKTYNPDIPVKNCWSVPMGDRGYRYGIGQWTLFDLRVLNPWWTKYCNCILFLQFAVSLWHYIPIPYVSAEIKIFNWYFQFGLGWGPENNGTTVLCGKFRFVNEKKSNEAILNPSDILGYWEGTN